MGALSARKHLILKKPRASVSGPREYHAIAAIFGSVIALAILARQHQGVQAARS
jgi:hypothetical protein